MALVFIEMDRGKIIKRSVFELLGQKIAHFILRLKKKPRPPYAQRDFDRVWVDFQELKGCFPVPGTVN